MRRTYRGEAIEVSFDLGLCVHIGECLRRSPAVFELRRRPWIVPEASDAGEVAAVVERCPSGHSSTGASMVVPRSAAPSPRA